jgi:hypothetical protein
MALASLLGAITGVGVTWCVAWVVSCCALLDGQGRETAAIGGRV